MISYYAKRLAAFFLSALALSSAVQAGGVRSVRIPDVSYAANPMVVDGMLGDWTGVGAATCTPFDDSLTADASPAAKPLKAKPSSAKIFCTYDTEALYVAVEWKGSHPATNPTPASLDGASTWWKTGDGIELHVLSDKGVHVASWPLNGKQAVTAVRVGKSEEWQQAAEAGITSALIPNAAKHSYTEEIRIPWKALTTSGKAPATGALEMACDVVWKDINPAFTQKLSPELQGNSALTTNFSTASMPFSSGCYVKNMPRPDAGDWGDLIFGTAITPLRVDQSPLGTAISSWSIPGAAQAPAIDGKIEDWKAPFAEVGILPGLLGSRFGAKIAMQYDAENLYLAAHFQTSGPQQNLKAEATKEGFKGGDALQIRLSNDKGQTVNLCGWFDSTARKPALTIDQGEGANNFLLPRGAKEAFVADADQMGYTQEIAIPWNLIYPNQTAPKAGDRWKLMFQPWWSGLDPRFAFAGQVKLIKKGAINVAYDLPGDGEVSLGVYDGEKLVSNVLRGEFRNKGKITDAWDGLDQWGAPVPPGNYRLKGLYHPRVTTDYVMSYCNPGNPPWPTPDNKGDWLSDEACPQGAATDGKWVFLAAPGSEKGNSIMAVDENGQRQWGGMVSINPASVSLAVSGDYLYVLFSGAELTDETRLYRKGGANARGRAVLLCLDKRTGEAAKFTIQKPQLTVATWPFDGVTTGLWELRTKKTFSPDTYAGQPRYAADDIGEPTNAMGIAVLNDKIYIALHQENKILVLNMETAQKIDEIPIPKPAGLHAIAGNMILAVSDKQVVRVDPVSKHCQPVVTGGLVAPRCVTTDKQNRIYVSDWADSFQVKVFGSNGAPLKAIGKAGGRPWVGAWDPTGMILPTGIAVTDAGKLWVTEDDAVPKRISVWNSETGTLLKDYIGPAPYGGGGAIVDPQDTSIAYGLGMRFKLDLGAKTWTPLTCIGRRMDQNQPFAFQGHDTYPGGKLLRHGGQEYLICNAFRQAKVYQRKGDLFVPVAAVGSISHNLLKDGAQKNIWDSDLGNRVIEDWYPEFFKEHLNSNFSWCDLNGDGLVQPEEMQWAKILRGGVPYVQGGDQPGIGGYWGFNIGDDWNIFWGGNHSGDMLLFRLDMKGWTPGGAPIYNIQDSQAIVKKPAKADVHSVYSSSEGKAIVNLNYDNNPGLNSIECFDRDGKFLWAYPVPSRTFGVKEVHFENILHEFDIPGLGKVMATWIWHGNFRPYLFAADGLFVSSLLEPSRLGPCAAWDESFKAYFQDAQGVPYVVNGASAAYHILKINGLEGGRFEAPFTLTEADATRAAKLRELPEVQPVPKPLLKIEWANQAPAVDGNLDEWNLRSGATLEGGKGRTARVALSRDETNLYLAYEVNKERPLANQGGDWQKLFITGDCVDLMLGTHPTADPHRPAAVEGDQRLLMTIYQGKPIAVLYRPVVPGTKTPVQLMAARLDEIKRMDSVKVGIQSKGNTYMVEAAVPLKDLGIDPNETGLLQGDVGVIFSDETGGNRSQRLYHYNKKTAMTADLTTEATLQPGEWGAIQFPLGKNLLKNGGFNDGLAASRDEGWVPSDEKNGGHARIGTDCPRSGAQSMILEQTEPVLYPAETFEAADYSAFIRAANGGKEGGCVSISQTVPVTAGRYYSLRFCYRAQGLRVEVQKPSPERGYASIGIALDWVRPDYKIRDNKGFLGVFSTKYDNNEWKQLLNWNAHYGYLDKPYLAPEGATAVNILIRMNTEAANCLPKVYLDDLEFVEFSDSKTVK